MADVPASENKIQIEGIEFLQPFSESVTFSIGGLANALREIITPVGSILISGLTEVQFQSQNGNPVPERWILADGRNVAGSQYEAFGFGTTVPDLRGIYIRGKNNGRSIATGNVVGEEALGAYEIDNIKTHSHTFQDGSSNAKHVYHFSQMMERLGAGATNAPGYDDFNRGSSNNQLFVGNTGGNETRWRTVTMNFFIRIN